MLGMFGYVNRDQLNSKIINNKHPFYHQGIMKKIN
jgi:hypothetical protein